MKETVLYTDVELELSYKKIENIFKRFFGTRYFTSIAETAMNSLGGSCRLGSKDCVYGFTHLPLEYLKESYNVLYLSQVVNNSIGSM